MLKNEFTSSVLISLFVVIGVMVIPTMKAALIKQLLIHSTNTGIEMPKYLDEVLFSYLNKIFENES